MQEFKDEYIRAFARALAWATVAIAFLLLFGVFWRNGGFYRIYQISASGGLLLTAFYFFALSKGDRRERIGNGLLFLVLSPVFFLASEFMFWRRIGPVGDVWSARLPAPFGFEVYKGGVILLMAVNGLAFGRELGIRKVIGLNLLTAGLIAYFYFVASP